MLRGFENIPNFNFELSVVQVTQDLKDTARAAYEDAAKYIDYQMDRGATGSRKHPFLISLLKHHADDVCK